jgi:tRNA (cmo5U34)-methyltransferase
MREEVPDYERLQDETVAATGPAASAEMLEHARAALPGDRVDLHVARLEDPLPRGRFDVVVSVLAVHHLDGRGKAELFGRVAASLVPGGRLVLGDVVVPEDPCDAVTPIDRGYDMPDSVTDQLSWIAAVGLLPSLRWAHRDLAVVVGEASGHAGATDSSHAT